MPPFPKRTGMYRGVIPLALCTRMPTLLTCLPPVDILPKPYGAALW